jgi:hypothetical protein
MQFQELFQGYTRSHGVYKLKGTSDSRGKAEGSAMTVTGPISDVEWQSHLSGTGNGIGVIPLMDDNVSVRWGVIDIDRYPLDFASLEKDLQSLPVVITKSKSNGAHIWLFLKEPTPASLVIEKLSEWKAALGFGNVEVFPKQWKRITHEDVGNWINLPYYGNSRRCYYKQQEISLEDFLRLAEARQITRAQLEKIRVFGDDDAGEFADGPPCFQMLMKAGGILEGARNNGLFNVGLYFKSKNPGGWRENLARWNKDNVSPPLSQNEIEELWKTIEKKEYNYTCSKAPIVDFCNRKLCRTRPHGVARNSGKDGEINVAIDGLTKINTTKPRWLVNIEGIRTEIGDTEDLINQTRFSVVCIEKVHKVLVPVPAPKWRDEVQRLLENVEVIEAPLEASPEGQFYLYFREFVEKRGTDNKEAILRGNVYLNEGKAYFKSTDLYQYLKREGFRDLKQTQMYILLHALGLEKDRWNLKGTTVSWWAVPYDKLQDAPFDAPTFGEAIFGDIKKNENKNPS